MNTTSPEISRKAPETNIALGPTPQQQQQSSARCRFEQSPKLYRVRVQFLSNKGHQTIPQIDTESVKLTLNPKSCEMIVSEGLIWVSEEVLELCLSRNLGLGFRGLGMFLKINVLKQASEGQLSALKARWV